MIKHGVMFIINAIAARLVPRFTDRALIGKRRGGITMFHGKRGDRDW